MRKDILVVNDNKEECNDLCEALNRAKHQTIPLFSLISLEEKIKETACLAVILDLNALSIDNRLIKKLTIANPEVYFFGLSEKRLNPEFQESICYHIYACLNKPIDLDELLYWIKCICEDESKLNP